MLRSSLAALSIVLVLSGIGLVSAVRAAPADPPQTVTPREPELSQIDIRSSHAWCPHAGICDGLTGTTDYFYAEADAFTFTAPWAGRATAPPQEVYAACGHAYTTPTGARQYDQAWVDARLFPGGATSQGQLTGMISVPAPGSNRQSVRATGTIQADARQSGQFFAFNPDTGQLVSYAADNRALVAGSQVTNNRTNQILSGGFHITLTSTIRHFHRAYQVPYGFAYWHFDGVSEGPLNCDSTRLPGEATTLQDYGDAAFYIPS